MEWMISFSPSELRRDRCLSSRIHRLGSDLGVLQCCWFSARLARSFPSSAELGEYCSSLLALTYPRARLRTVV